MQFRRLRAALPQRRIGLGPQPRLFTSTTRGCLCGCSWWCLFPQPPCALMQEMMRQGRFRASFRLHLFVVRSMMLVVCPPYESEVVVAASNSDRLHIVDHPLVQHKLSILRDKRTPTKDFRQLLHELAIFEGYEALRKPSAGERRGRNALRGNHVQAYFGQEARHYPHPARWPQHG